MNNEPILNSLSNADITQIISKEIVELNKIIDTDFNVPIAIVTTDTDDVVRLGKIVAPKVSVFGPGYVSIEHLETKCLVAMKDACVHVGNLKGSLLAFDAGSINVTPMNTEHSQYFGSCAELIIGMEHNPSFSTENFFFVVGDYDKFETYNDAVLFSGMVKDGDIDVIINFLANKEDVAAEGIRQLVTNYDGSMISNSEPFNTVRVEVEHEKPEIVDFNREIILDVDELVAKRLAKMIVELSNNDLRSIISTLFSEGVPSVDVKKLPKASLTVYAAGVADGKAQNDGTEGEIVQDQEKPYRDVLLSIFGLISEKASAKN